MWHEFYLMECANTERPLHCIALEHWMHFAAPKIQNDCRTNRLFAFMCTSFIPFYVYELHVQKFHFLVDHCVLCVNFENVCGYLYFSVVIYLLILPLLLLLWPLMLLLLSHVIIVNEEMCLICEAQCLLHYVNFLVVAECKYVYISVEAELLVKSRVLCGSTQKLNWLLLALWMWLSFWHYDG